MRAVAKPRGSEGKIGVRIHITVCLAVNEKRKHSVRHVASIVTRERVNGEMLHVGSSNWSAVVGSDR